MRKKVRNSPIVEWGEGFFYFILGLAVAKDKILVYCCSLCYPTIQLEGVLSGSFIFLLYVSQHMKTAKDYFWMTRE